MEAGVMALNPVYPLLPLIQRYLVAEPAIEAVEA